MPQEINRPDYPHSEGSNIPWEHAHSIHQWRLLIYRAHISATWYCRGFCNEWLTLNSLIIKSRLGGSGIRWLLFSVLSLVIGVPMVFSCDHAVLTEGWVKEKSKEAALMEVWGSCPHPLCFSFGVLHAPVQGCRSCTFIMAHINGGSFAKRLTPSPLESWVWFAPKDQQLSGLCPSRTWDHPGSDNKAIQWQAGRLSAKPVATWEFTHSQVFCTT